jgi:hypothetical protein
MTYNYCGKFVTQKLKIDGLLPACRFAYCDCRFGTKYERKPEYCYECDEFKEEGDKK